MKAADGISSVIVSEHSDGARHTATLSVYRTTLWLRSGLLYAGVPEGPRGGLDGPQQHGRAPGALPRHL